MKSFHSLLIAGTMLFVTPVFAQTGVATEAQNEILRQKLEADKKFVVSSNMVLTDAEAKVFWPLYEDYQKELERVQERLGNVIKTYEKAYNQGNGKISNDLAKTLLDDALSVQEEEVKLKRTYAEKIGKVLPAAATTRYIQIENKIDALVKGELARRIPLVY